ncbi:MAG: hypothetical protein IIX68_02750 [Clostridia bacterium]|nr:hypothetical protein [Clostridia bacterium]
MYQLYGDGLHDDTAALQQWLDSGAAEIALPEPSAHYVISKTLKIHSGQTLRMAPTTRIRLADNSNCSMLENADFSVWAEQICIDGGIWDYNNIGQEPNPFHFAGKDGKTFYDRVGTTPTEAQHCIAKWTQFPDEYTGFAMRFCRVRGLTLKNLTYRDPVTYGVEFGCVENFTVQDIRFDYAHCNPKWWNMDGVHIEGGCKNGLVRNLQGACHDDMVAITADDFFYGPIDNVVVDGLHAEKCHSAVRLLSHGLPIRNVTVRNLTGSYYVYCIGLTKYHGGPDERGVMENIVFENVDACSCSGTPDVGGDGYPFIWVQDGVDVRNLQFRHVRREETERPKPFLQIDKEATVNGLVLDDLLQINHLDVPIPFLQLNGRIDDLVQHETHEF